MIVVEDASDRRDVAFSRVVEGRWKEGTGGLPPAHIVLVDFADFKRVMGDRAALAAFNVGWAFLHEVEHAVRGSADAPRGGEVGECEGSVNRMRRECGLAERAEYHFTLLPGTGDRIVATRFVRLAFVQSKPATNKKKRLWLVWDAALVGGLPETEQLVAVR